MTAASSSKTDKVPVSGKPIGIRAVLAAALCLKKVVPVRPLGPIHGTD